MTVRPKVVVTQRIHPEAAALLETECRLTVNHGPGSWTREELLAHCRDGEGLMVFMPDCLDAAFLDECPRLRVVAAALKGFDNFDVEACTQRGIWFSIVPDLLTEPTAELALALMLGLGRNVLSGDGLIRSGGFEGWRPVLYGQTLMRATVGIIGFGKVGRALARLLTPFDCRLLTHDINGDEGDETVPLTDLLRESDFVLPLLPLTAATLHLLNRDRLALMKPGALLVNVSRGSIVDEEAVADALETRRLGGYAADVFEMEDWAREHRPRKISPRLLALTQRTLFTPHLGSAVGKVRIEIERSAATNILEALRGAAPSHAINQPIAKSR